DLIYRKAIEKKLLDKNEDELSEDEKIALIFLPGFSSIDSDNETSGRGVGMDIVKTSIESAGGQVIIQTELGKGTVFKLELPIHTGCQYTLK
ncbi:MAG: hypothetical protein HRT89_04585, partial [Lentisphaeria bacterium]|nr:hypothetical protein [Lentisphaeria bacterium]